MSALLALTSQPASYADLLRYTGWADAQQLWGMMQAWVNVVRMFAPDIIVLDHSPTALLAVRCATIPCVLVGTGFELPPLCQPLPPFPGFSGSTAENAAKAEAEVLANANLALTAARVPRLEALRDLFKIERRWLATFAELDHYGARPGEQYVGPIGEVEHGERLEWPMDTQHRVFAYLRSDTPELQVLPRSLAAPDDAEIVCYGPGIPAGQIDTFVGPRFIVANRPVDLPALLRDTSLCVSYAPAGTIASTLLHGVPQLMAPAHLEAQMTAHRVECMGAGLTLRGKPSEQTVTAALNRLLKSPHFTARAAAFAEHHRGFDPAHVADNIVEDIESRASRRK